MIIKGTTLRQLYKNLGSEKRIQFWAITSTAISTILTFWLGFTIQYFVLEKSTESERENEQNLRFQLVNHIYPTYQEQHVENSEILSNIKFFIDKTNNLNKKERTDSLARSIDIPRICHAANNSALIMDKARFCFDEELHHQISRNNMMLLFGSKVVNMFYPEKLKELDETNVRDSLTAACLIATMVADKETKDTLTHLIGQYIEDLKRDTLTDIGYTMEEFRFEIARNIILPSLESNEKIMNEKLHSFIEHNNLNFSMGIKDAFRNIWYTFLSGSNLPRLIYSIMLLLLILLVGFFIWMVIVRMTFSPDEPKTPSEGDENEQVIDKTDIISVQVEENNNQGKEVVERKE